MLESPARIAAAQLVVESVPLLRGHRGSPPDLVLRWNHMPRTPRVDVVVHLHGYSGRGAGMRLTRDKAGVSGLDFTDPADPSSVGRRRPTLLVLPRGNFFGGRSGSGYDFPALQAAGGLDRLVAEALRRFGAAVGAAPGRDRLLLTAHSGGGAALMRVLRHTDPDEVHAFDALYGDPAALVDWALRRRARADSALRVLFRPGEGTARASHAVAAALGSTAGPAFRVEATRVAHGEIPRRYGWRLLADAAADLPGVTRVGAPGGPADPARGPVPRTAPAPSGSPRSTAALRQAWAEFHCAETRMVPLQLLSHRTPVNPVAADAFRALAAALTAAGYVARRTWVFNCRAIRATGATGAPRASLHAYGLAVDVDPAWNPHRRSVSGPIRFSAAPTLEGRIDDVRAGRAGTVFTPEQVAAVEALRTVDGRPVFTWGGRWRSSHDAMHFQIAATPDELRRGLAAAPARESETCGAWETEADDRLFPAHHGR